MNPLGVLKSKLALPRVSALNVRSLVAILCVGLLVPADVPLWAQEQAQTAAPQAPAPKIPGDQLDALVAPIALYPDPLLSQTLVASTYPLEIVQLQQWLVKNPKLKDKELAEAVKKQSWDPSVQSMAALPDVVKRLSDDIAWTTDLGNAFLAQQDDVMDAVQRMRKKAMDKGNLKSSEQQKVETKVVENKTVVVVEQANPQVVYVPSYNPTVVYGPPVYAYPPISYPPPGYYAAGMAISFGVGVAMGAMWSGGWGYNTGWHGGGNNVYVNNNNNFNRNTNISGGNRNISGGNRVNAGNTNWQHNSQHRGGAPYSDRATANKYGGSARGDARQNTGARGSQAGTMDRGGGSRGGQASSMDRGGGSRGAQPSSMDRGGGSRGAQAGSMDRGGAGGGDRAGNRSVSPSSNSRSSSALGSSGGYSGSSARSSSQRGSSSMGSSRGGGGGSRGGGGGRRR